VAKLKNHFQWRERQPNFRWMSDLRSWHMIWNELRSVNVEGKNADPPIWIAIIHFFHTASLSQAEFRKPQKEWSDLKRYRVVKK
jgi:hypothetical protein